MLSQGSVHIISSCCGVVIAEESVAESGELTFIITVAPSILPGHFIALCLVSNRTHSSLPTYFCETKYVPSDLILKYHKAL